MSDQVVEIQKLIREWCPKEFDQEPELSRALRALTNMNACIMDQRDALAGLPPVRPLGDYPGGVPPVAARSEGDSPRFSWIQDQAHPSLYHVFVNDENLGVVEDWKTGTDFGFFMFVVVCGSAVRNGKAETLEEAKDAVELMLSSELSIRRPTAKVFLRVTDLNSPKMPRSPSCGSCEISASPGVLLGRNVSGRDYLFVAEAIPPSTGSILKAQVAEMAAEHNRRAKTASSLRMLNKLVMQHPDEAAKMLESFRKGGSGLVDEEDADQPHPEGESLEGEP